MQTVIGLGKAGCSIADALSECLVVDLTITGAFDATVAVLVHEQRNAEVVTARTKCVAARAR